MCEHPDPGSIQRPLPIGLEDSPLLSPAKASSQRVLDEKKKTNYLLARGGRLKRFPLGAKAGHEPLDHVTGAVRVPLHANVTEHLRRWCDALAEPPQFALEGRAGEDVAFANACFGRSRFRCTDLCTTRRRRFIDSADPPRTWLEEPYPDETIL